MASELGAKKSPADGKRRLPVLPSAEAADEVDEDRPPWHWSAIGVVAIFVAWLPLAFVVSAAQKHLLDGVEPASAPLGVRLTMIGASAASFALASFGGGFLVGRFGGQAGPRQARVSGGAVGAIGWAAAATQGSGSGLLIWAVLLAVMLSLGALFAGVGAKVGLRARSR